MTRACGSRAVNILGPATKAFRNFNYIQAENNIWTRLAAKIKWNLCGYFNFEINLQRIEETICDSLKHILYSRSRINKRVDIVMSVCLSVRLPLSFLSYMIQLL